MDLITRIVWPNDWTAGCCLGYPKSQGCNQPVRYLALAADPPDMWLLTAPAASVGGYCSLEHANAEPRPTLADAQRIFAEVRYGAERYAIEGWQALLDAYPNPVPLA